MIFNRMIVSDEVGHKFVRASVIMWLDNFFNPGSVAIVGTSRHKGK